MQRLTTMFTAAAVGGLAALAVTVAAPAIGDDTTPDQSGAKVEHRAGPGIDELRACLQSHGATGVPGDEGDGSALKDWIAAHQGDASSRAALQACDVYFDDAKPGEGGAAGARDCAPGSRKANAEDAAAIEKKAHVRAARARPSARTTG